MDPAKGKVILSKNEFIEKWTGYIIIFSPYKKLLIFNEEKHLTKKIIEVLSNNKIIILNIFLLSIIFTIISCIITYYFQVVIDFTLNTSYFNLIVITLIFIILVLYKSFANYF